MLGDGSGDETPGLHQTTSCGPANKTLGSDLTERMCLMHRFALFPFVWLILTPLLLSSLRLETAA